MTEVANGSWRARGVGPDGLIIERGGTDDSRLLNQLIEDAIKLAVKLNRRSAWGRERKRASRQQADTAGTGRDLNPASSGRT